MVLILTVAAILYVPQSDSRSEYRFPLDLVLEKITDLYDLRPIETRPMYDQAKYELGRMLFFDKILSGNGDRSCSSCHRPSLATTDGQRLFQPLPVGSASYFERFAWTPHRHVPDLFNRDASSVHSLFWDGRISANASLPAQFDTILEDELPVGLENLLSVQSLFPLVTPKEMLGYPSNSTDEGDYRVEQLLPESPPENLVALSRVVFAGLMRRLLGDNGYELNPEQKQYRAMFKQAYPDRANDLFSISDVSNAIAHFQEFAFATDETDWDRFLRGNRSVLARKEKQGAILFFGKARCVVCHNGPLFSDFEFHSLGILESNESLPSNEQVDLGREPVTNKLADKFQFRTPPLRNVSQTGPYFHNGSADSLEAAIHQHANPFKMRDAYGADGQPAMPLDLIQSVSAELQLIPDLSPSEVDRLIAFLKSLEDDGVRDLVNIVPESVPSGMPVDS